jgi:hypothetical protein
MCGHPDAFTELPFSSRIVLRGENGSNLLPTNAQGQERGGGAKSRANSSSSTTNSGSEGRSRTGHNSASDANSASRDEGTTDGNANNDPNVDASIDDRRDDAKVDASIDDKRDDAMTDLDGGCSVGVSRSARHAIEVNFLALLRGDGAVERARSRALLLSCPLLPFRDRFHRQERAKFEITGRPASRHA